jgi:aryl-alcohol dehydrogenase-like predicted oxidoreductase
VLSGARTVTQVEQVLAAEALDLPDELRAALGAL